MKLAFWIAMLIIGYAYIGYAGLLWLYTRVRRKPVNKLPVEPPVSIVMAVHNAGPLLKQKLENLSSLDYPSEHYEVIVVSDGSSDDTNAILSSCTAPIRPIFQSEHLGKAAALNRAVSEARADIVVFTDVRQQIEPIALRNLVSNFADEDIGCVSGELMLDGQTSAGSGVGLYWKIEKALRRLESSSGSAVGATGAFYAIRKALFVPIPSGAVLDDVIVPLNIARKGRRVVFEPTARAWDYPPFDVKTEFRRKVRTLTGNYQLLRLTPWAFTAANPLFFRFISHKILRLAAPFALVIAFTTSWSCSASWIYFAAAIAQTCVYGVGIAGLLMRNGSRNCIVRLASTFCMLNAAAAVAFCRFVQQRHDVGHLWQATRVQADQSR